MYLGFFQHYKLCLAMNCCNYFSMHFHKLQSASETLIHQHPFLLTYREVMLQSGGWIGPQPCVIAWSQGGIQIKKFGGSSRPPAINIGLKHLKEKGTSHREAGIYWCSTTWLPSDSLLKSVLYQLKEDHQKDKRASKFS